MQKQCDSNKVLKGGAPNNCRMRRRPRSMSSGGKMKKGIEGRSPIIGTFVAILALTLASGCTTDPCFGENTAQSMTPECLVSRNPDIDMVVVNGTTYERVTDGGAVTDTEPGGSIGTVRRTDVDDGFRDDDATKLPVGTELFSVPSSRTDILARTDAGYVRYRAMVEG
ncbi:hypothetical protein [uncultured Bifidobacterium sp.]|uniref:hypothetical protein n=1 Tax=uncultured Bifidobacterium sp. TaxID=165187 RepID=UPI00259274B7|nr:hypothetical protein [uncultured Bifidobacterium sp.]